MAVRITVRNVPEAVRDELAARAALAHKSMQEYLLGELERLASKPAVGEPPVEKPSIDQWLARVRERLDAAPTSLPAADILHHSTLAGAEPRYIPS